MKGGEECMIGKDKSQVFLYPPKTIKRRLARLRNLDRVKYAESKIGTEGAPDVYRA